MRKFDATEFVITKNFSMKVDPIGLVSFFFDTSIVEQVDVPKHVCKIGLMDKVYLTKDTSAYDPAAEVSVAMSRGCSEFVAVTMGFLRGLLITTKKLKVAKCAIQVIPKLTGKIEVKQSTAEALIEAAEFWYSASSWITKYATLRANKGFMKVNSVGETLLPWLMRAYSKDAHMPIVISNFIESCLFAPFQVESLIIGYARNLEAEHDYNVPKMYIDAFASPLGDICAKLSLAYNMMNLLVRKSEYTELIPESGLVMRQLLFALEIAVSAASDRVPIYQTFDHLLDIELISDLSDTLVLLNTMLKISKKSSLNMFSKVLTAKFGIGVSPASEKDIVRSLKAAKKGDTFTEFQVILGKLANILQVSVV